MALARLPRNVIILGLVSFLNDLASDMVIPLLPILLSTIMVAGPIVLGLMEGVADAVAAFLKLWSGRHSDLLGGRRKMLTVIGYGLSNIARPLLGLAGNWVTLLALRSADRVGKGIRSAPRDAMIVDSTPRDMLGFAFGWHRALDNAGAVLGALAAAAALTWFSLSLGEVILWSALPGVLGVLLIWLAVREPRTDARPLSALPALRWSNLSTTMRRYLGVLALFTFARASETFIVLRGQELGMSTPHLLVLWAALNLAKALVATWGGAVADRAGRSGVLLISWASYGIAFIALSAVSGATALWIVTLLYGVFAGLSEGAERALIGDLAAAQERGTAFGWYNMILGLAAIPAGLLFGSLWHFYGATSAWLWAGIAALLSAALLWRVLHARQTPLQPRES